MKKLLVLVLASVFVIAFGFSKDFAMVEKKIMYAELIANLRLTDEQTEKMVNVLEDFIRDRERLMKEFTELGEDYIKALVKDENAQDLKKKLVSVRKKIMDLQRKTMEELKEILTVAQYEKIQKFFMERAKRMISKFEKRLPQNVKERFRKRMEKIKESKKIPPRPGGEEILMKVLTEPDFLEILKMKLEE